jgi:hypothetical protein
MTNPTPTMSHDMSKEKFSNQLSDAEIERLAILAEECAEVQQVIMKILRHGYESYHPEDPKAITNRELLSKELGHLQHAARMMINAGDVNSIEVAKSADEKQGTIDKYLHHQTKLTP